MYLFTCVYHGYITFSLTESTYLNEISLDNYAILTSESTVKSCGLSLKQLKSVLHNKNIKYTFCRFSAQFLHKQSSNN